MLTGGCLCGAVRYEADGSIESVTYCHCARCRRWHGHVGAYFGVARPLFRLTESRGLKWFPSSEHMKRGFCAECGSSVLCDESPLPKIGVCAGTLDGPTGLRGKAHIYVGSKGDYYEIADALLKFETMPGR
jgi:hypothetical protein